MVKLHTLKFNSQRLFFSKQTKKITFLESDSTTKAFAQLNSSQQGSLKFQRLTNQIGASL